MTVISSEKDAEALTLTFVVELKASVERAWQLWADPRQLERWWGPPTWPATFDVFEFEPGGKADYYMTGPEGDRAYGWWEFTTIEEPTRVELDEGFADADRNRVEDVGSAHMVATLEDADGVTRMTIVTHFASTAQLEQMIEMGMQEGMGEALGQIDAILAER
ncbi:Uncharacterized conserved protein YndB, AHSA1/START domain [Paramicrobacterium humi]|jgi:uncharacterized protein YndB with AHSA1/START domain|uniref:Uncharacterized conserved protein YndB, AHSA1/START domain n=1 Tax=Paramicrobacterium humi TaxID=640635 RepID=A0A1H4KTY8_9MICO|nr:SRPBCC domain-containing protein [Microbacterium humi]SEB61863.1 Uncharacterized conserved protein YndB, AHSA1/START domain [Microbacterium humi]